jgi:proteasome lid subunit RPN8/RPN11
VSTLIFTPPQLQQIRREGSAAYPNECCGAILGHDKGDNRIVDSLRPLANSFEPGEQFHRFRLDPLELAQVDKEAGQRGLLVLGFYHSHPDHPARPSEYDRVHAWPFYSYVIVAIEKGKSADLTSWLLDEATEQFVHQPILEAQGNPSAAEEIARQS